jgi:hypothetical protein
VLIDAEHESKTTTEEIRTGAVEIPVWERAYRNVDARTGASTIAVDELEKTHQSNLLDACNAEIVNGQIVDAKAVDDIKRITA